MVNWCSQIYNGTTKYDEYDCNHDFDIADYGEKIPSDGARVSSMVHHIVIN